MCWKHCALTKNNMHGKCLPDKGKYYLNGPIRALCFAPGKVYTTGVNFTSSNSKTEHLWAVMAHDNYILSIVAS